MFLIFPHKLATSTTFAVVLWILPNQPLFQLSRCQELKSPQPNCSILTSTSPRFPCVSPNHSFQHLNHHYSSGTVNQPSTSQPWLLRYMDLKLSVLNNYFSCLFPGLQECKFLQILVSCLYFQPLFPPSNTCKFETKSNESRFLVAPSQLPQHIMSILNTEATS